MFWQTYIGNGNGANDGASREIPQAQRVGLLDAQSGLQDRDGNDKVRSQNDVAVPVDRQPMGGVLLPEDVEGAGHVGQGGPLGNDVKVLVRLDQAAGRSADRGAHVRDEEASVGLGADLVRDGCQDGPVALQESRPVRVSRVKVVRRVLSLEEGQETAADEGLAIERSSQVVGAVAAGGHIGDPEKSTKSVLDKLVLSSSYEVAESLTSSRL